MMRSTRVFAMVLAIVMFAMAFAAAADAKFTDVPENTPLALAVEALKENNITKGVSATAFGTAQNVTREQMAAFIYRMVNNGESKEGGENKTAFTDLQDPTFYAMISWANENGIIRGISDTKFNPKGGITLQDCYTMVVRALGDKDLVYPQGYIEKAKEKGLAENVDASIAYTKQLTRGDVAIILHNALSAGNDHVLDGKKIIFIGNSHTYYGKTVIDRENVVSEKTMAKRFDDQGYFYQLCKQNGANVSVTNWTWGAHQLDDIFDGSCNADRGHDGHDHLADLRRLSDMKYDYVVIQPGADSAAHARENIAYIQKIFREANPDAKFLYMGHARYYFRSSESDKDIIAGIAGIAKDLDLTVIDWGEMVYDIATGKVKVANATQEYNKNTFIVSKSASDGYHPNLLTGYITTQMVYSAITGESAVGEDYAFCTDADINKSFDLASYLKSHYTYDNISPEGSETKLKGDALTTFPEIFNSPADMLGLQKLMDKYLGIGQ